MRLLCALAAVVVVASAPAASDAAPRARLDVAPPSVRAVDPDGGPKNAADAYRYLENPRMTGEGQQAPHALLRPYGDAATAAGDVTEHAAASPWVVPLSGPWRLRVVDRPEELPAGFHADGYDVSGWPVAQVPHTWQSDFLDHPMFRNIPEEIWPDDPPRVPRDINPAGAYVRTVGVPDTWDGRPAFLRFEGATSGYFVWVNGRYVGYDQGGYTPAEFDVSTALRPGANTVAVQLHRWGSGSYLEDFDQWRYSGIFRDVWLYSTPQTRLADLYVTADGRGALAARVDLARAAGGATGTYTVRGTLRDAAGRDTAVLSSPAAVTGATARVTLSTRVAAPALWSAEEPNLYTLLLELVDPAGTVSHITSQAVGFREVAVANRQILVNGGRILVRGVNRAETDPDTGRHVSRAAQRTDVMLMKRLHVNAVRTSHYPSDPYFYDLADRHGLWLADEVDIETHAHDNCPSNCLADKPEWQDAFADRFRAMVHRDKNHPSVIFWDTGNEAGLGPAHQAMADWATANDPTRLLYHQPNRPNGDAPFAHVLGTRYPMPAELEAAARNTTKPIVMGEYAHAMGNGLGNFDQFWALARRLPQVQGGFVWDWAEQNLRQPLILTPDSASGIQAFGVGKPGVAPGRRGQALALSGLDDYVDVFRDRRLDVGGSTALSVDAWVRPGAWSGSFPIVTKGLNYALQMRDERTLEFGVDTGSVRAVAAPVPANWRTAWHRVTGVYDGANLRLYIDGAQVAAAAATGALNRGYFEVNIGRNAETQVESARTRFAAGLVDDVRVYKSVLTAAELRAGADPVERATLALNFDTFTEQGEFLSLGESLSGTDGLVGADRYPQPETAQLAWAQSPLRFRAVDAAAGRIAATNEQQAGTLDLTLRWALAEPDRTVTSGTTDLRLAPGQTVNLDLPAEQANPGDVERWLNLTALTTRATPWAPAGSVFTVEQFAAGGTRVPGVALPPSGGEPARVTRTGTTATVAGTGWSYDFSTTAGTITAMTAGGAELLRSGGGPKLAVYRPPTSNESFRWGTEDRQLWRDCGLDRLRTTVTSFTATASADGGAVVEVRSTVAASDTASAFAVDQTMRYSIDRRGTITLAHHAQARGSRAAGLPYLPRVGFSVQVPEAMQRFAWYGRGKQESYADRRNGTPVGVWTGTVDEEYVPYSRPQAYGNHTDTRWATLSDGDRAGLLVAGDLDVSVTPYDDLARAEYDFQLPLVRNAGWVTLTAAHGETGMGETPNSVLPPFRLAPTRAYDYQVTIRPLTPAEVAAGGVVR